MGTEAEEVISTCVRFSRLISEAREPRAILSRLVQVSVELLGADASLVLQVLEGGDMQVVASRNIPQAGCARQLVAEMIGRELEEHLLEACGGRFQQALTVPLVSSSNLYGALVLLFHEREGMRRGYWPRLVRGLADLGAVALDQAFHRAKLERSLEELRATRELMARTERLRALGEMSTGIAHDLRNIFNPLTLQLELLRRKVDEPQEVLRVADALERVVRRGVETVERLRLFGHQSMRVELEEVDLDMLVDETLALSRPRLERYGSLIQVRVEKGGPARVRVRGTEVVTALMNLIFNALDAMPEGGTLSVGTGVTAERGWLRVSDTGVGMTPEVKARLFEPFFTTKGKAGTGLGLSMVDAFVKRSGGTIRVESEPGRGASFTLSFPLVDPSRVDGSGRGGVHGPAAIS